VTAGLGIGSDFLSTTVIKALNFHAITCLHVNAGEYRPCAVKVGEGDGAYLPPHDFQVQARMDDFVNRVNRSWDSADPVSLATFVLWQLNHIHPFINGNGRTARASCYFVLCLKFKQLLPGKVTLPELLTRDRDEYVVALKEADKQDPKPLHAMLTRLIAEQISTAEGAESPPATEAVAPGQAAADDSQ
jgi:Fic family protein